ncbi:hypothetical protein HQN84_12970 [Pedobacter steynii]|uniref:hypothetical protein n=1 Tax=Pedobacter steynii TaxID=430522 RepID=UPI00115FB7E0|nr:hypothetical protein [Pedobacter steynii]NQX39761.1 hypothetical protein [Pedobacter steynii]
MRFATRCPIVETHMDWFCHCPFCAADGNTIAIDEMEDKSLRKMEKLIRRSRDFDDLAPVEFQTGATRLIKLFDPFNP